MLNGASFTRKAFVQRPTALSVAMSAAGVIPGAHMLQERALTAVVRGNSDHKDVRPSVVITL